MLNIGSVKQMRASKYIKVETLLKQIEAVLYCSVPFLSKIIEIICGLT